MKWFSIILVVLVSLLVAGCVSSPAPTPTPAPSVTATTTPIPTLIGGNDEAHIQFFYALGTETSEYGGMQKPAPGYLLYIYKVNVSSDKPVPTSLDWFGVEYKVNETDPVRESTAFNAYMKYPEKTIGSGLGTARAEIFIELPKNMAPGYPKIYYYKPLDKQQGPYKVYDKVYGVIGDVQ